ncbi:hypothetical protein HYC85_026152 [Camellia sinensis]|uniref:Uncharacterized protein n=1 Tax=Camellia sinensis TaxID=4442 RepID=A0A7J7G2R3_CAMSI|nr:hypothetical protein HYC85_026152 [Camellia sinensis]
MEALFLIWCPMQGFFDMLRFICNLQEHPEWEIKGWGLLGRHLICLQSSNPGNDIYVEFFLPVSNKVGGNVMTSLMKEILGTMKKKIQSFKLASGEELGEELIVETVQTLKPSPGEELGEEFSEVIDFHNGEKFNFVQISQTRPEPLQNGADLMELESSDQQSMDAVNNESNVISAERSNSTCSQGKGTRKKLKRKQNKTGVSISTLKRLYPQLLDLCLGLNPYKGKVT